MISGIGSIAGVTGTNVICWLRRFWTPSGTMLMPCSAATRVKTVAIRSGLLAIRGEKPADEHAAMMWS